MSTDEYRHVQAQLKMLAAHVGDMLAKVGTEEEAAAMWAALFRSDPEHLTKFAEEQTRSGLS